MADDQRAPGVRMPCPHCYGTGKPMRATVAMDRDGDVYTLVHPYPCKICEGQGWLSVVGPPG